MVQQRYFDLDEHSRAPKPSEHPKNTRNQFKSSQLMFYGTLCNKNHNSFAVLTESMKQTSSIMKLH